jgi:hypothetical protein
MSKKSRRNKKKRRTRKIIYLDLGTTACTASSTEINQIANDVFGSLYYQMCEENKTLHATEKIQQR